MADAQRGIDMLDGMLDSETPALRNPDDLADRVDALWDSGLPSGSRTGWPSLDKHYTVAPGQLTVVTGWPSSGKSSWLDALLVNLMHQNWIFAMFSPEHQPAELHIASLLEKLSGKPFGAGPTERMTREEVAMYRHQLAGSFRLMDAPDGALSIRAVIDASASYFEKSNGKKHALIIDPWNEFEHWRPSHMSETEYISHTLSTLRAAGRKAKVHTFIVAHPAKVRREEGKLPIPRPDMIASSQHWWNKADNAITVNRDQEAQSANVDIYVQKVRFKHIGRPGLVSLAYDRVNGRYHEPFQGFTRVADVPM